jgi:hypothetical protein
VNIEFDCACGTLHLDGRDLTVRLAEGYAPVLDISAEVPVLWKYFAVADFRTENEVTNHAPIMTWSFPLISNLWEVLPH